MTADRLLELWSAAVRLAGAALTILGVVILFRPGIAAPLFAIAEVDPSGTTLLRAIALRDLAFGAFLLVAPSISVPATIAFLAAAIIIPLGDLGLASTSGGISLALLPHACSGFCLATLAALGFRLMRLERAR